MFTGIIEEIGVVNGIKKGIHSSRIIINANKILNGTEIGDSICTNGVCLTVTDINYKTFETDIMAETLRRSNLANLKIGSKVNLERALTLEKRIGGHLVSGHIDGIGTIKKKEKEDNAIWITVSTDKKILRYIIKKGSIAIDGISLTVAYVGNNDFKVSIIPHTGEETILLNKDAQDTVNLECDQIGKYIEKFMKLKNKEASNDSITKEFLCENGFI
ncbi:MAG: riboflavin synthase [Clostridium sp.]|nr:riboflavin synthase [Clostridium sp.]